MQNQLREKLRIQNNEQMAYFRLHLIASSFLGFGIALSTPSAVGMGFFTVLFLLAWKHKF